MQVKVGIGGLRSRLLLGAADLRGWVPQQWLIAGVVAVGVGILTGVPTDLVPTALFTRMTPVTWWSYPSWGAASLMAGLLVASYVRPNRNSRRAGTPAGPLASGGLLATLAVGCPVCNKLVLLLLGTGGALQFFAPVQPALAILSLVVLAVALWRRLASVNDCSVPGTDSTRTDRAKTA